MYRDQPTRSSSPWTFQYRIRMFLWDIAWASLCRWTPKPLNFFRILILRLFGAKIDNTAFVHQRARISHPWNLAMSHGACLGDGAHAYCLANIYLKTGSTVAQEVYLCTASHDFTQPTYPLIAAPIVVGEDAFVGARAFILPGITIGRHVIVGACSVVSRSVPDYQTIGGNPARTLRHTP